MDICLSQQTKPTVVRWKYLIIHSADGVFAVQFLEKYAASCPFEAVVAVIAWWRLLDILNGTVCREFLSIVCELDLFNLDFAVNFRMDFLGLCWIAETVATFSWVNADCYERIFPINASVTLLVRWNFSKSLKIVFTSGPFSTLNWDSKLRLFAVGEQFNRVDTRVPVKHVAPRNTFISFSTNIDHSVLQSILIRHPSVTIAPPVEKICN